MGRAEGAERYLARAERAAEKTLTMSAVVWNEAAIRDGYQAPERQAELRMKECEARINAGRNVDYNETEFDEASARFSLHHKIGGSGALGSRERLIALLERRRRDDGGRGQGKRSSESPF